MKKTISISSADPVSILGPGNRILNELCTYYPGLEVSGKGSELTLEGDADKIRDFEEKISRLTAVRSRKLNLTVYDVEDLFASGGAPVPALAEHGNAVIVYTNEGKAIRARNANQERMVKAYFNNDLVFAVGPAGTGKTYIAIALAVRALKNREVRRIILTRPAVEAGERLGFLPGDLKDKLDPYLQPLYDALGDMIPARKLQEFIAGGTIQIAPLAYMRGRTLDGACVILDEAQNTNMGQLKMFLTRMGTNAKFLVTGDATQVDLPRREDSGLLRGIELLKGLKGVESIFFDDRDIVRHPLVSKIVKAFNSDEHAKE